MKLYSTNNKENIVELREAVLNAFPPDRGLYFPVSIEKLPKEFIESIESYSFQEIAYRVSKHLFNGYIPDKEVMSIVDAAFNFPVPLVKINNNISVLELFHGPSLAFKDFGARFMAELMSYFLKNSNQRRTILVATSGDTGGAVASGFYGVDNIDVIILYPSGKVSELQEKQLCTWGNNIKAIEIDGVFDDCQALVKEAFLDEDLRKKYVFSSANSINIARLIPQSFYYFEAYKRAKSKSNEVCISVPSGNFGNLTAGLLAKRMGLPIHKFIAATNINRTFTDYIDSGVYRATPSKASISNAMDVGNPSNFPRILELYCSTWNMIKDDIESYSYTDEETKTCIKSVYNEYNYILDPHAAVAYLAAEKYLSANNGHCTILETAHPAKFLKTVEECISTKLDIPEALESLRNKDKISIKCKAHYKDVKQVLMFT